MHRRAWRILAALIVLAWLPAWAAAQGVELSTLQLNRRDGALQLDFVAHLSLPQAVEEALQRGVPVYFVAQAQLLRSRWYWRDERVARVARSWRLAYQPLTSTWRVSLGGLNQSHMTLAEALTAVSRSSGWKLADLSQIEGDKGYYVEFSYRLDNTLLPSPMQISIGPQTGWTMGVERTLRLD